MANISQNIFDKTRGFRKLVFQQGRPVADYEMNELQDILHEFQSDTREFTGAFGFWGDGFYVETTGNDNELLVRKGLMITGDSVIILAQDYLITGLTTATSPRVDEIFLQVSVEEATKTAYPDIVNPVTGQELAVRAQYVITIGVAEDRDYSALDIPAEDQLITFATLERTVGNAAIAQSEINDERAAYSETFVAGLQDDSLRLSETGGLGIDIESGKVRVFGTAYDIASFSGAVTDDALNHIYISETGTLTFSGNRPTGKFLELWRVTSSAGLIVNVEDRRRFPPGGLVNFIQDATVELSGIRDLYPSQTRPPSLQVAVAPGQGSYGTEALDYFGGLSPSFTAPTLLDRTDLLLLNSSGALEIVQGLEGGGSPPTHAGRLPIAEVTLTPGQTEITNADIRDVRPLFNLGGAGGAAGSSVEDRLVDILTGSVMGDARIDDLLTSDDIAPSTGTYLGPSEFLLTPGSFFESSFASAPADAPTTVNEIVPAVITDTLVDFADLQIEVDRGGGFETSNGNGFVYVFTGGGTNILNIRVTNVGLASFTLRGYGLYYNQIGGSTGPLVLALSDLSDVDSDLSAAVRDTSALRTLSADASNPLATLNDVATSSALPGEVKWVAYSGPPPSGWLACDGSQVSQASYPNLYAALGTTWGPDGGGLFTLPDLRGRSLVGSGTGAGLSARSVGDTGGEENHQLTVAEMPSHTHTGESSSTVGTTTTAGLNYPVYAHSVTGPAGGDQPHNTMHPFAVLQPIIKT